MTTFELYRKHKKGEISREKFLYEVRRDNNLPWITNLTSYDDAVSILKNKGIVTDENLVVVGTPAIGLMTEGKESKKEVTIDTVNPYEYRHGIQFELTELDEYTDEALEKAKDKVLKNLAKDANFYSNLLNAKQSPFTFKQTETDKPGMQAKADGYLKKEAKKDEKANVQDSLGKKEEGSKKPKGVKIMPDKGVTGSEKTIKEGIDDKVEDMIKSGKIKPEEVKAAAEKAMKGDSTSLVALMAGIKLAEDTIEEAKKNKYIIVDEEGDYQLDPNAIKAYLKSVIDSEEIESVDSFINDDEGYGESSMYFFDNDEDPAITTEKEVEDWAKQEMSYYLFSKPDEFPGKEMNEHHNDPNFPGGTKIHAMLDKVANEWGKDSDVYSDLEDAIIGWSDRNGELSPKGILAIKALLSNWDMLDDYEEFLGEGIESDPVNGDSSAEGQFNQLMSKYDWYYEMSDDPRTYDRGLALDQQLKSLAKTIGVDKAVAMFNAEAPSDRKITNTFFAEGEDKHAKIKEILKKKVKEAIFKKSASGGKEDVVVASSTKSTAELTKRGYTKIPGTEDATGLKS